MAGKKKPVDSEKVKETKKPEGRPSSYNQEIANEICRIVATHPEGQKKLCIKFPHLPSHETINEWRWIHDGFSDQYAKAKMMQAELMAEDIIDISDNSERDYHEDLEGNERFNPEHVQRARLRVDSRKWMASKLAPKIYGDRVQVQTNNNEETEQLKAELKALREQLAEKAKSEY